MAPDPQTPSAEQHGLEEGHGDVALHAMSVCCAETSNVEPPRIGDEHAERTESAPRVVKTSCEADLRFGLVILRLVP